jgi:putative C-S lyase
MEFVLAPEIQNGLLEYLEKTIPRYGVPGPGYYSAVCSWMKKRHAWDIVPEWIVVSGGVVPALFHCVDAFTKSGDGVIIMPPAYPPFFRAIKANSRKTVLCPLVIEKGRYVMDFDRLKKILTGSSTKLLIFSSPHNPVGRVWEQDELETLASLCAEYGVIIVSDEIHHDLILDKRKHLVLSKVSKDIGSRTIVCTAPSKTFNIAGFQVSNIIIENPVLRQQYRESAARRSANFELNIIGTRACELAYTRAEAWLEELIQYIQGKRDFAESFINSRIPGISVYKTEGSYLQWWDCRGLGMDQKELERFMTEKALLFLDEGYIFGDEGAGFERVNLACPRTVLEAALLRLEKALHERGI